MSAPTSLKFRLERLKHISNFRDQLFNRFFDNIPDGDGLSIDNWDNYLNGRDEFHLHFHAVRPFCATLRCHVRTERRAESIRHNLDQKGPPTRGQFPMFIWIRKGSENFRPITSFVRLQPLDSCYMACADTIEPGLYASRKLLWRIVDRKLRVIMLGPGIEHGEFVNEIVKSGSQIVANLSEHDAHEMLGSRRQLRMDCARMVRRIRIEVHSGGIKVSLSEIIKKRFELKKMFLCPIDPLKSAVEWMGSHENITEAMISAGEEVLLAELGGGVEVFWYPRDLAISVYQAMQEASRT